MAVTDGNAAKQLVAEHAALQRARAELAAIERPLQISKRYNEQQLPWRALKKWSQG